MNTKMFWVEWLKQDYNERRKMVEQLGFDDYVENYLQEEFYNFLNEKLCELTREVKKIERGTIKSKQEQSF